MKKRKHIHQTGHILPPNRPFKLKRKDVKSIRRNSKKEAKEPE